MIRVKNVSKSFKRQRILKDINLEVKEGTICGIIGRNGSGKTVLFKCICGFFLTDSGKIEVQGKEVGKNYKNRELGLIIEEPGFLKHYSGYKNLAFLMGLNGKVDRKKIYETLKLVGLYEERNKAVGKYSMGMKQRLGIAQAIMEGQTVLILDEPMNGLDNEGVMAMRKLFLQLKQQKKTILLASHSYEDIAVLCDEVYEMDKGFLKKIEFPKIEELMELRSL